MHGEHVGRVLRHRHGCRRRHPDHVAAGTEAVEARAAGGGGGREPDAARVHQGVAILREGTLELVEQAREVARDTPGAGRAASQRAAVDGDVHAADC